MMRRSLQSLSRSTLKQLELELLLKNSVARHAAKGARNAVSTSLADSTTSIKDEKSVGIRWVNDESSANDRYPLPAAYTAGDECRSASGVPPFSLARFFREMKRLRKSKGELSSVAGRAALHREIEAFWERNVDAAAMHLQTARDVGFLAGFGLSSRALRASRGQLRIMCRLLVEDRETATPYDCCLALRYVAREVAVSCAFVSDNAQQSPSPSIRSKADKMLTFLIEFGEERLRWYFMPRENRTWVIGKPVDAVEALEFIAETMQAFRSAPHLQYLIPKRAGSANHHQQQQQEQQDRSHLVKDLLPFDTDLVSQIFAIAAQDVTAINTTGFVRLFALLRIFHGALGNKRSSHLACAFVHGLEHHDHHLVNPYHVLKVVQTLARVKPFLVTSRRRSSDEPPTACSVKSDPTQAAQPTKIVLEDKDPLQDEKLWQYVISKTCLVYRNMSRREQEMIYEAVKESLWQRKLLGLIAPLENERREAG